MAEINVTEYRSLHVEERWDAEYFQEKYDAVAESMSLIPTSELGKICRLQCSAFYPSATELYADDGVPFIRCVDVNPYPVIRASQPFERIPQEFVAIHGNIRMARPGDIVISKVGSPCYSSVVASETGCVALSRTVLVAQKLTWAVFDPYYLVAFLRSKFGFQQLLQQREQQIQFQLTLDRVRRIRVFLPDENVQRASADLVRRYAVLLQEANDAWRNAVHLFESLVLPDVNSIPRVGDSATSLTDMLSSNRWDAQCFDPRLRTYEDRITRGAFERLDQLVYKCQKGRQQDDLGDAGDVSYASIRHINQFEMISSARGSVVASGPHIATKDDLLLAITGATIGKVGVVARYSQMAFSGDLLRLRVRPKVNPYFLLVVLSSSIGQAQLKRWVTGSTNGHLAPRDVVGTLVPRLGTDEETIAAGAVRALALRMEAERAFEEAVARVETEIHCVRDGSRAA